jgi:hypothetical protein
MLLCSGSSACEVADVTCGCTGPVEDNIETEEDYLRRRATTSPRKTPLQSLLAFYACWRGTAGHTEWEYNTKTIKDDVRHCILRQCLHTRILDETAPKPTKPFDEDSASHDNNSRQTKLNNRVIS